MVPGGKEMFKVNENCKLSAVGVEFIIPKGFYIDIENMEGVNEACAC